MTSTLHCSFLQVYAAEVYAAQIVMTWHVEEYMKYIALVEYLYYKVRLVYIISAVIKRLIMK